MEQKTYFEYEQNTGKYLRAVFADTKPENSTELEPAGLVDAVFNTETNKWEGTSIADEMAKAKGSASNYVDHNQKQLASITKSVMSQLTQQNIEIAKLKAKIAQAVGTTNTTQASADQTNTTQASADQTNTTQASADQTNTTQASADQTNTTQASADQTNNTGNTTEGGN